MTLAQRIDQIAQARKSRLRWCRENIEAPTSIHRTGGALLAQLVVRRLGTYGGSRI